MLGAGLSTPTSPPIESCLGAVKQEHEKHEVCTPSADQQRRWIDRTLEQAGYRDQPRNSITSHQDDRRPQVGMPRLSQNREECNGHEQSGESDALDEPLPPDLSQASLYQRLTGSGSAASEEPKATNESAAPAC